MHSAPVIMWFRRDLRIKDNPALRAAHANGAPIIPVFILEDINCRNYGQLGSASKWWLHHSLTSLNNILSSIGSGLVLRKGEPAIVLTQLLKETNANSIYWNRRYYKPEMESDKKLKETLTTANIEVHTFNGSLLREPWEVKTGSGGYYKVFTPYWRAIKEIGPGRPETAAAPRKIKSIPNHPDSALIEDWNLLPTNPNWAKGFEEQWFPGEEEARRALRKFLKGPIDNYDIDRNHPSITGTSRLSPHLAFGEISPLQIWHETMAAIESNNINETQGYKFLSEIVWREFAHTLLYFNPDMPREPLKQNFKNYPWKHEKTKLKAWQQGLTGYPIVDAGMRELWQTGWMHNRVRMISASFLIKHLLIPWQEGERWFWDTLVDADIANNAAGWQWVAGSGADAAPYFRIFNPFGQGEKFDPEGNYVKKYIPELQNLPAKYIHQPWAAPDDILEHSGVRLGDNYPNPIIDHSYARKRALDGYQHIKGN